jgi:hypothetical protein
MKKIKSLNIEINTKILEHTSTKLSKILENTINPNKIDIKQQYWIKKLIEWLMKYLIRILK